MIKWILKNLLRFRSDDSGAVLVLVSLALPAIFGFAALSIDLGYAYYIKAKLQNAADIGALAGGTLLYKNDEATVESKALEYVGFNIPGNWTGNTPTSIRVTSVAETKCLNTLVAQGLTCDGITKSNNGANGANALRVTLTARAPLIFASALGYRYANFTATAQVSGSGSAPPPMNIAIVIDNSRSMYSDTVSTCGTLRNVTKMRCALYSMQGMIATLWPSIDQVGLFVMPGLSASLDSSPCGSTTLTRRDYRGSSGAVYKAVSFSSDYRLAGTPPPAGLNAASNLVKAIGYQPATPGATSTVAPCLETRLASASGVGSYFASSIQAAQAALVAANTALVAAGKSPRQNVMMILTDGDANATQIDTANANNQCAQGVAQAAAAKAAVPGTWVYAVAFKADDSKTNGRPNGSSCNTDTTTGAATVTKTTSTQIVRKWYTCDNRTRCGISNTSSQPTSPADVIEYVPPPAPSNPTPVTTRSVNPTPTCSTRNCTTATWTETTVTITYSTTPGTTSYTMTACDSIKAMASDTAKFFSTGDTVNGSTCTSPVNQGVTDLTIIFKNVALSLMKKRRIPKNIN